MEFPLLKIKEEHLPDNAANSTDLLETIKQEDYLILDDPEIQGKTISSDFLERTIKTELIKIKDEVHYDVEAKEGEKIETKQANKIHLQDKEYKFYEDGKSVCLICRKVCLCPQQLEIHHEFFHIKKRSKLPECKVSFAENTIDDGDIVYYCSLCNFKCYLLSSWKNHMKSCHAENACFDLISQDVQYVFEQSKKSFQCKLCEFNCSRHSTMKTHVQNVHLDIKRHLCELCGKRFHNSSDFKIHMRRHTGEKPYKCTECDYVSCVPINEHILIVHNKVKPYHCNVCEYKSPDPTRLKIHMRTHTGEKPFKCLICDYAATHKFSLMNHMKKRHTNAA